MKIIGFASWPEVVVLREPACAFNNLANDEIGHIALHEASGALAVADDAGDVHNVDVGSMAAAPGTTSGAIVPLRGGHTSICTWVAFRPGCNECCSAGLDALCVRWDWRIAAKVEAWPLAALGSPFAVALAEALPGSSQSSGGAGSSSEAAAQPSQPSQLLNPRHAHCASIIFYYSQASNSERPLFLLLVNLSIVLICL